jgi:hypothetical protein
LLCLGGIRGPGPSVGRTCIRTVVRLAPSSSQQLPIDCRQAAEHTFAETNVAENGRSQSRRSEHEGCTQCIARVEIPFTSGDLALCQCFRSAEKR